MIQIECLACEKALKIPQYIDRDDYDGQVVCQECGSILHIKLVHSKVQGYKVVEKKLRKLTADEYFKTKRRIKERAAEISDRDRTSASGSTGGTGTL